jgi:hypothetical protein
MRGVSPTFTLGWTKGNLIVSNIYDPAWEPRHPVELKHKIDNDLVLELYRFEAWQELLKSMDFLVNVNQNWLDFYLFKQEVVLPDTAPAKLEKLPQYSKYAGYSMTWVY